MNEVTLEDKIHLIYEFNNSSPLFARAAFSLIEEKKFEEAVSVLEEGLKIYPNYPTARIIYANALANLGRTDEAVTHLTQACDIIDSDSTKKFYLKKFEEISNVLMNVPEPYKKGIVDDLDLEDLAKKIEEAKIPKLDNTKEFDSSLLDTTANSKIVSETMANILYKQGNLIEALSMYEELLKNNPDKKNLFEMKINDINKKLSS